MKRRACISILALTSCVLAGCVPENRVSPTSSGGGTGAGGASSSASSGGDDGATSSTGGGGPSACKLGSSKIGECVVQ